MTRAPSNVVLDANVWGRVVNPTDASGVAEWIDALVASGRNVIVPEISDYEVRRSLLRLQIGARRWGLYDEMLDALLFAPITTQAVRTADADRARGGAAGGVVLGRPPGPGSPARAGLSPLSSCRG